MVEPDELDRYIDSLINAELSRLITEEIGPCTCQFLKYDEAKGMVPFASGVLVELSGSHYILTASHVIGDWSDANKLFVEIKDGFMAITGKGCGTEIQKEEKIDGAYIKLKDAAIPVLKQLYKFLALKQFLCNEKVLDEANYCVYGYYPVSNPRNKHEKTIGAAYFVRPNQDKVFEHYGFNPISHYVLEFKGKAVNIVSGKEEKIKVEHYGLSGGGLWYTTMGHDGEKLISSAYLIGVMTEFRRGKYDCLIANRIEGTLASIHQHEGFELK